MTTDRNDPALKKIKPNGQQEAYLVLSEEERAKGFVRPVRQTYRHLKRGTTTTMGRDIAETYARDPKFYGGTFCCACGTHFPLVAWVDEETKRMFAWVDGRTGQDDGTFVGE